MSVLQSSGSNKRRKVKTVVMMQIRKIGSGDIARWVLESSLSELVREVQGVYCRRVMKSFRWSKVPWEAWIE